VPGRQRQCSRTACAAPAAVTLTYDYGRSQVWIDELAPERDPHAYDLCAPHAEHLKVPLGWKLNVHVQSGPDPVGVMLSA
jgi:hypothetical protein